MATVLVWYPKLLDRKIGHAAIQVGDIYVSWFPGGETFTDARRSMASFHTLKQDVVAEMGLPDYVSADIQNLDEKRITRWARQITNGMCNYKPEFEDIYYYQLMGENCANIVLRALAIGLRGHPQLAAYLRSIPFATPGDCQTVAEALLGRGPFSRSHAYMFLAILETTINIGIETGRSIPWRKRE